MTLHTLSLAALDAASGGIALPRLSAPDTGPRQPENWDFWGPHLDRDLEYRPDRDGEATPSQPPVERYEEGQEPNWGNEPARDASVQAFEGGNGDDGAGFDNTGVEGGEGFDDSGFDGGGYEE